jgi:hypothetical protein
MSVRSRVAKRPAWKRQTHQTDRKVADHRSAFMPVTKLIFGLRTDEEVTLTVTGHPKDPAPDLLITTHGQTQDAVIAYDNGAWTATLPAGDYVVRMEPGDHWFEGEVKFTLSAASMIVIHGDEASPKPMAWRDMVGAVNNPKNPWPPPRISEALPDQAWFSETLAYLNSQISLARSSPDHPLLLHRTGGDQQSCHDNAIE